MGEMGGLLFAVVIGLFLLFSIFKILNEWERAVILRFGHSMGIRGPGIIILIPFVEKMIRIDTRTITMDVQPQDVITRDNVTLKVNAVIYFRVVDPESAVIKVEDYYFATSQLAQTTLRSVLGQFSLDDLLANRDKINHTLQAQLDKATESWGIKISVVEVKHIDLPKEMQRAMAKEAEAERERRSKIISAEGELQRSEKLAQASMKLSESPAALSLAYLQSMTEIQKEGKNTIILPIPIDLIKPFLEKHRQ
jgi:regulator of protease activity HflC (stomatin/prohibitin superfamily)